VLLEKILILQIILNFSWVQCRYTELGLKLDQAPNVLEKDFETVGYVLNPKNSLRTALEVISNEKKKTKT